MKRSLMGLLAVVVAGAACGGAGDAGSQEVHPRKAEFADVASWATTGVGGGSLANFEPFRAVYERVYRNGQGEERRDHVIVTAERVAWNDIEAISVSLIDTGNSEYDDTAMRVQTRVFAADDHRMLLYMGPVPGTARDYMIAHLDGTARSTMVEAETGEATVQVGGVPLPQLGVPGFWLAGSMPLQADQKIAFSDNGAPAPSSILGAPPLIVSRREMMEAGPLGQQNAWVAVYPLGMTSPRVVHSFLVDRPPYLLGKRPMDLETGETSEVGTLRLVGFTTFGFTTFGGDGP